MDHLFASVNHDMMDAIAARTRASYESILVWGFSAISVTQDVAMLPEPVDCASEPVPLIRHAMVYLFLHEVGNLFQWEFKHGGNNCLPAVTPVIWS